MCQEKHFFVRYATIDQPQETQDTGNRTSTTAGMPNRTVSREDVLKVGEAGETTGDRLLCGIIPFPSWRRKWSVPVVAKDTLAESLAYMTTPGGTDRLWGANAMSASQSPAFRQYEDSRRTLVTTDKDRAWYAPAKARASKVELLAHSIIFKIRESERIDPKLFGNLPSEAIPDQESRDMGGRFLANKPRIERSKVFAMARRMPKGAHLHIHFNSELPPEVLFVHARSPQMQETMCIRTTRALRSKQDFADAEMVLNIFPKDAPKAKADCFSSSYSPSAKPLNTSSENYMLWKDFRSNFPANVEYERIEGLEAAECWAREKMVVMLNRAYSETQTHNGAWACFNIGTRAFKGLLNYESAYRWYIGQAIDSMIRDGVMYAELRPMLMDKSIPSDDGLRKLDHKAQMEIIREETQKKRDQLEKQGQLDKFPSGLKIIYSTPRSIAKDDPDGTGRPHMQRELNDCIKLKQQFPDLICGFDLVGAEDRPNNIGHYADLLVAFVETCKSLGISIPFLFHAGESLLDTGGSFDPDKSNLYDALLLNSRRIGHGYALLKHPALVEKYKKQNICLELCPISNELLHLCGNIREHPYPALLAAGLHCTLNADNPGLYRGATKDSSSLSYEFYQVMVGDTHMNIHGWKQLAEWSIEHSCLSDMEKARGLEIYRQEWEAFCEWVVREYGEYAGNLPSPGCQSCAEGKHKPQDCPNVWEC